jgi:cytochrome c biogenesis protein CcmG, thiol:disulfide interchange protein DsbE
MRRSQLAATASVAAVAAGLLAGAGCGWPGSGSAATGGEGPAALPLPTPDSSLVAAAALDHCPSAEGDGGTATLPDAPLPCLGPGPAVRLSALRGGPTVVNVWATWCGPCRTELPHFQWLHDAADGRVRVLGVLYEDDPAGGLAFARRLGVRFPSVIDVDGELKAAGVVGLPATFFVAPDGTTSVKLGEVKSRAQLRDLVAERLGVSL